MKSSFGTHLQLSLFGESHGPGIGVVLQGLGAGIPLDLEFIQRKMDQRRAWGALSTQRHEPDQVEILSGFYQGRTTGTPLCLLIANKAQHSGDYSKEKTAVLRPSHADYTAYVKYKGYQDPRGGGHFPGRLTAPIVAAGAICQQILAEYGIVIGTHICRCRSVRDSWFSSIDQQALRQQIAVLEERQFPVLNLERGKEMEELIGLAAARKDSLGGVLETAVCGLPAGVGEPFFDSVESILSHLLFSIPGVKGVEFGVGFGFGDRSGSEANDSFIVSEGQIKTRTNFNGGINGGITNGMPVIFKTAIKPTPSIGMPQDTVNFEKMEETTLSITGRHDPAIFHRARAVVDAMTAIGLCELMIERQGTEWTSRPFID